MIGGGLPAEVRSIPLLTAAQMQAADRRAIEGWGIPARLLMELAGSAAARWVRDRAAAWGIAGRRCLVLAGKGNNGADGLVAARHLHAAGWSVRVLSPADPPPGEELWGENARLCDRLGIPRLHGEAALDALPSAAVAADLVLDALLGTGLAGPARPPYDAWIAACNRLSIPVLALDLPSGLRERSGEPGDAVRARATLALAWPKLAALLHPGAAWVGEPWYVDIGIPAEALVESLEGAPPAAWYLPERALPSLLPPRPPAAHKGDFGHVLVVGGSPAYVGAPALAAAAALRAGAGLVTLVVPEGAAGRVRHPVEAMCLPAPAGPHGGLDGGRALEAILPLLDRADRVILGPGLGRSPEAGELAGLLLEEAARRGIPLLLDADAFHLLPLERVAGVARRLPIVLTPHPGEAAAFLGASREGLLADPTAGARALAAKAGAVAVWKQAQSLIAAPDGELWLNPTGNSGLASGGSGDVLAGLIAGLWAQGSPDAALPAALAGVSLHGLLADSLAAGADGRWIAAGDLVDELPALLRGIAAGRWPEPGAAGTPRLRRFV